MTVQTSLSFMQTPSNFPLRNLQTSFSSSFLFLSAWPLALAVPAGSANSATDRSGVFLFVVFVHPKMVTTISAAQIFHVLHCHMYRYAV